MEDEPEPQPEEAKPSVWKGATAKILISLGVLQVYNIVSHQQNLVDLSQSIQLIAAWWRYLTGLPFHWLGWSLSQLQRDVLVLMIAFGAAANVAWYRANGKSFYRSLWELLNPLNPLDDPLPPEMSDLLSKFDERRYRWGMALLIAVIGTYLVTLSPIMPLVFLGYLVIWNIVLTIVSRSEGGIGYRIASIAMLPMVILMAWFGAIYTYIRPIILSLKYLLLILILDVAAKYAVDPLLANMPQIPMPPVL